MYAYCLNNPVNMSDNGGQIAFATVALIVVAAAAVITAALKAKDIADTAVDVYDSIFNVPDKMEMLKSTHVINVMGLAMMGSKYQVVNIGLYESPSEYAGECERQANNLKSLGSTDDYTYLGEILAKESSMITAQDIEYVRNFDVLSHTMNCIQNKAAGSILKNAVNIYQRAWSQFKNLCQ